MNAVAGGVWLTTGVGFLFALASYPMGALAFVVVSEHSLESITNPYARAFIMWAPFFILGWLQWSIVFPVLRFFLQRALGRPVPSNDELERE